MDAVFEMRNITKRFPGIVANQDVNLSLYGGEVHALCGENGAGKTTLMNILTGIYFPNEGEIFCRGKKVRIDSPHKAVSLGIGMVHQHFKLVGTLTVAENIALYAGTAGFLLKREAMEKEVKELAERFNLEVDPSATVEKLSIGEQQRVEILKLLSSGAEVLILDEPTAVLTPQESTILFSSLKKMACQGKAILVITHKLSEVMSFADRVTVLRHGRCVGEMKLSDTDAQELADLMVGRHVASSGRKSRSTEKGKVVLSLDNVSSSDERGAEVLSNISFDLSGGEILGIAGVSGNGQKELCEVIAGLRKLTSGRMTVNGKEVRRWNAKSALSAGVAYIPDDRIGLALAPSLGIPDNLIMKNFSSDENSRHGILKRRAVRKHAEETVSSFDVRSAGLDYPVSFMSGGNIQKLIIAREVQLDPAVIVASYPTHGLDIGAAESVHEILLSECEKGKAVLFVSEDLDELFELCDRIAVMYDGGIAGILDASSADIQTVGRLMLGNREEVRA